MNLFELFGLEVGEDIMVQDVRTDKQVRNRYSYDVGEKLVGAKKEIRALKESFLVSFSLEILAEIEKRISSRGAKCIGSKHINSILF